MILDNKTKALINNFQAAINAEIEFLKGKGGKSVAIITNGKLVDTKFNKYIYQFTIDNASSLVDDSPIHVAIGNESSQGNIIAIDGTKILISLEQNTGVEITEAKLIANTWELLDTLHKKLSEVKENKTDINTYLTMKVFNYIQPSIKSISVNDDSLDNNQLLAVSKSLGSDVFFIWGPPGTGKTFTLGKIVKLLFEQKKSILIVSNTNVAVDSQH